MLERALHTLSVCAAAIVLVSFGLFAIDETRAASDQTAIEVAGQQAAQTPAPSPSQERARERAHGSVREWIDDANDVLVAPFAGAAQGPDGGWGARALPAVLALLLYGFGLGFLARYARGRA